jgi:hypothetical protein
MFRSAARNTMRTTDVSFDQQLCCGCYLRIAGPIAVRRIRTLRAAACDKQTHYRSPVLVTAWAAVKYRGQLKRQ